MGKPILYLASVASSCREMLTALRCHDAADLMALTQQAVGDDYVVEGDAALIEADEDDVRGGRFDDAARATDITRRLADPDTAAWVALRGGAWLTRILGRIDFEVLSRRRRRTALFGFSELTSLLNVAAAYRQAFCVYDLGPGFIRKGLSDLARRHSEQLTEAETHQRFVAEFMTFFRDVSAILSGLGSSRSIAGRLVSGTLPGRTSVRFVGGNLSVLTTLPGTPYGPLVDPQGRWLVLEDVNESPDRIDRRLAHLKLAGWLERCAGLVIGDFHDRDTDHQESVVRLLAYHLPAQRAIPVITTEDVGHVWPVAPLPLNSPVVLEPSHNREDSPRVRFEVCWPAFLASQAKP